MCRVRGLLITRTTGLSQLALSHGRKSNASAFQFRTGASSQDIFTPIHLHLSPQRPQRRSLDHFIGLIDSVSPGYPLSSNPSRHPAYLVSKKMPETPEKVVEEQVNPEQVEAQRVAEAAPGPDSEVPSTESPSSRPMTRSQTGRASKRRNPEEAVTESKKRATPSTKKQKTVSRQASTAAENDEAPVPVENVSTSNPNSTPPPPPIAPVVEEPMPPSTSRITFLEVSTAADAQGERRISRSRAVFPVPVPNLTKKSRGRRVPTSQNMETAPAAQPEKRVYVCKADGCGKCFHRGEHLKRHIRSIHTHEKPFKCSFPSCGKFFNRHDNLLQHLKVHKDTKAPRNQKASTPNASESGTPPPGPESQLQEPESPTSEAPDSPVAPRARTIYDHQPNLYAGYVNAGPFESTAESMRFQVTNMAVSSLRTEIPQSPTEPHQPPPFPWHRPEAMQDQLTY